MKFVQKFSTKRFAQPAAQFMKCVCYVVIFFYALCTVLSFMGRQSFLLHTKERIFETTIYAEENHASNSQSIVVHSNDDIHVWTNDKDQIDIAVQIGISLMYVANMVPMIVAFWFLSRVFRNIQKEQIFTEQNADYLLYYGLLQFLVAVLIPFIKLLICWFTNLVSNSRISISTGQAMFNMLISSIAFIVAAYILHYGVHLQDEVDHTL